MSKISETLAKTFLAILLAASFASPIVAKPFAFIDEGASEPGFAAFRARLIDIADKRDLKALRPHIHPNAIASFGGQQGWDMLMRAMQNEPGRWATLSKILRKGGKFRKEGGVAGKEKVRAFYAPYTFFAEVPGADATVVLMGPDVPVYDAPKNDAKVIRRFSDEALEVVFGDKADNRTWYEVKMPNGQRGFVSAARVAVDVGDRVGFVKHKGKWKMHVFVGGD
jgi:hypothetical protein